MGLFFGGHKSRPRISVEVSAKVGHRYISDRDMKRLRDGWKMDVDGKVHPPDTVWVSPRSKVYHHMDYCRGAYLENATPMPEKKAIRLGLHYCSRCDWSYTPFSE